MNVIQGDLLELAKQKKFDVIAHGCNCQAKMGAGIALQVAKKIPLAKFADIKYKEAMKGLFGEKHEEMMVGNFSIYKGEAFTVLNLYTQIELGPDFRLGALAMALQRVNQLFRHQHIGLPKIGAGIGGGDWRRISKVIEENLTMMEVTIVEYVEPPKK